MNLKAIFDFLFDNPLLSFAAVEASLIVYLLIVRRIQVEALQASVRHYKQKWEAAFSANRQAMQDEEQAGPPIVRFIAPELTDRGSTR